MIFKRAVIFSFIFFPMTTVWAKRSCEGYLSQPITEVSTALDIYDQTWAGIWQNFARATKAHPDFKYISDLIPRPFTPTERQSLIQESKLYRQRIYDQLIQKGISASRANELSQVAYSRQILLLFFEYKTELNFVDPKLLGPEKTLVPPTDYKGSLSVAELSAMFGGVEKVWPTLVRKTNPYKGSSLLDVKEPILIAGGRFREGYYWDTYFGSMGLMATGRWKLPVAQLSNFVELVNTYGLIPNGLRTYYLSRSQPPVVSMMARLVYEGTRNLDVQTQKEIETWLVQEVYPALKNDYSNFWMAERLDIKTGLNFYSDKYNEPRPERHSHDVESSLGRTYRDVRAEAESGLDHTNIFQGQASQTLTVSLNSFMYAYEKNLSWLAEMAKDTVAQRNYENAAQLRQQRMSEYMWNPELQTFQNYHMTEQKLMSGISGDVFSALFVGLATPEQARQMRPTLLNVLELPGGIAASSLRESDKQWDGVHGWAPFQVMAIQGLAQYGFRSDANRIASKWLATNLDVYLEKGQFYEKLDLARKSTPVEDHSKYPTQTGFLWTNGSIAWTLKYLGFDFL